MSDRLCRRCLLPITEGRCNRLYHPACRNRSKGESAMVQARFLAQQNPGLTPLLKLRKADLAVLAAAALKFLPPQARVAVFRRVGLTPIPSTTARKADDANLQNQGLGAALREESNARAGAA